MATCPMCGSATDARACPICGYAFAPEGGGPAASGMDETMLAPGATTAVSGWAETPDVTRLRDDLAPWEEGAGLYRDAPITPPPAPVWGEPQAQPGYPPGAGYQAPPGYPSSAGYPTSAGYQAAPGYPAAQYGAPQAPRRSKAPLVAGVLVAAAALIAGGVLLVPRFLGAPASATPAPTTTPTSSSAAAVAPSLTAAPATVAPAPVSTQAQGAAGASGFFTVLDSLNKKWFTANQARLFADKMAAKGGRTLVVVDSDITVGMGAGYWVVGEGLLPDRANGERVCPGWGRAVGEQGSDCYTKPVTYSASSVIAGPGRAETPAQECQRVAPTQPTCASANDFLTRYATMETTKSVSASEIGNWWTDPGYYYSDTPTSLAALREALVRPTASTMEYLSGNLLSFQAAGGGEAVVKVIVPFRENRVLHIAEVTYVLVPGTGANPYRILKVTEDRLV